jgi:hypothetical protein
MSGFLVVFDFGTSAEKCETQRTERPLYFTDRPAIGVEDFHVAVLPDE